MTKLRADKAWSCTQDRGWGLLLALGALPQRVGGLAPPSPALWMEGQAGGHPQRGLALKSSRTARPTPPLLPVILGAGVQGKPPLDCSASPRSRGSRGLGLYSRLGREDASCTLGLGRESREQPVLSPDIQEHRPLLVLLPCDLG